MVEESNQTVFLIKIDASNFDCIRFLCCPGNVRNCVDGIAWHGYDGDQGVQSHLHDKYPEKSKQCFSSLCGSISCQFTTPRWMTWFMSVHYAFDVSSWDVLCNYKQRVSCQTMTYFMPFYKVSNAGTLRVSCQSMTYDVLHVHSRRISRTCFMPFIIRFVKLRNVSC